MAAQTSEIQAVRLCPVGLLFSRPHDPHSEVDPAGEAVTRYLDDVFLEKTKRQAVGRFTW